MEYNQSLIYQAFGTTTYIGDRVDVQHTPIYDTVTVAAATALTTINTAFFSNVGPASSKTLGQTNMQFANRLQAPQAFSVLSIRFRWSENIALADAYGICNAIALNFSIGQKSYNLAPVWHYSAGGGLYGWSATTVAATTIAAVANGIPSREAAHKLAIPLVLENQSNFAAELTGTFTLAAGGSGGTGLTAQLLLDGLYVRAVQ
jgi:hypothetical protein